MGEEEKIDLDEKGGKKGFPIVLILIVAILSAGITFAVVKFVLTPKAPVQETEKAESGKKVEKKAPEEKASEIFTLNIDVIKEILKHRHLAPSYGIMDYIPNKDKDNLIIKDIPDIVVMGNSCCAEIENWNNILIVSTSCWKSNVYFGKKFNCNYDPCKVPLFNLKNREIKIIDFNDNIIRWEKDDNLVCNLEDKKDE